MGFVLDALVAACWAFDDETHPVATQALERLRDDPAQVPCLWWFELRNVLVVNERRGRLTEAQTTAFLRSVARLPVTLAPVPEDEAASALARTHRLSIYEAAYLELAQRAALPLATLDAALARAARAEGLALLGA